MAMRIKRTITLDADFLLNDLLFWAMRYISGRCTYATKSAVDYAKLIADNRDKFNPDRLAFFARDVRSEICHRLHFRDNIEITGDANNIITRDAYSLIKEEMMALDIPWTDSHKHRYEVDCVACTCNIWQLDKSQWNEYRALHNDIDIAGFAHLADTIDRVFEVTVKYNGQKSVYDCVESIEWIHLMGEDKPRWRREYKPINMLNTYIGSDYIINTERKILI